MGWLIQRIHAVSANIMIALVLMHMARVAYKKIFHAPRELHWVSGICLFLFTLFMAFTGYLLPWTQLSYWGAKVGTEILGAVPVAGDQLIYWVRRGHGITGETLGFFYAMHVAILPGIMILFMAGHFFMIRRTGISEPL
jgi:quinol-cytochrome oxidoreductase complex cytochrome b subunit